VDHTTATANEVGFLHPSTWRPSTASPDLKENQNLRLLVIAPCKLSVLAIGRREWKRSARCMAGRGEVEAGVGCDAMEPADERLAMSDECQYRRMSLAMKMGVPDCAESLRSIAPPITSLIEFLLPSWFTAALVSPRLVVNTFKHTLRGGISSSFSY
jgi:hypothetical protein